MARASRDKGARYERAWAKCLRENGFGGAERGRDNGFRSGDRAGTDRYDTQGVIGVLFDVKAGYDTASPQRELEWLTKVDSDARATGSIGVLVRNRRGQADPTSWWAHLTAMTFFDLYATGADIDRGLSLPLPLGAVRIRAGDLILLLRAAGYGDPLPDLTLDPAALDPVG